ncbi:MAG: calcium/sodium antiporter, partial [Leptospiraceae bacterium]|nr:calcium/sodium antiporter [Leptospiraceae bacterium]
AFLGGLLLLILGAELLVRGASSLAQSMGISSLIIGLTVVAFGTSSPELAVSINAAHTGQANIAIGNVVGSNVFNVLFILGLSAIIVPLAASAQLIRLDVPIMIFASAGAWLFSLDGLLGRWDGLVLFVGLVAYIGFLIVQGRKEQGVAQAGTSQPSVSADTETIGQNISSPGMARWKIYAWNGALVLAGLIMLVIGSRFLVSSAVAFAQFLGVSDLVIGLTVVAAGTSMPEVVTSIVAALKGERDIAVGNVVGSNIFNLLGVLGLTALVAPGGIPVSSAVAGLDLPIMILVALACLPIFFTGGQISRLEGILLFSYYIAYTTYLILAAGHHDALPFFSGAMLYLAIPITAIALIFIAVQEIRSKRRQ